MFNIDCAAGEEWMSVSKGYKILFKSKYWIKNRRKLLYWRDRPKEIKHKPREDICGRIIGYRNCRRGR